MAFESLLIDALPYVLIILKLGLWFFGVVFLANGIVNELSFDLIKLYRSLYRSVVVFGWRKAKALTEEDLMSKPEQSVAIMIPCWDESPVIKAMLENSLKVLNYSRYVIFVGTYPNDPETQREVDLVRDRFENVERIVCPKDGPTSKADCLNWIYEGIRSYEKKHDMVFEIVVMEDSEDVLHPLTLKLFNYMVPRMDMVQLPVLPMEPRWYEFTRGTYVDEFATNHSRDMVVREILCRNLPSAGVGTAISRKLVIKLYEQNNHQLFTIGSVTEDYDFGIRLGAEEGIRQIFSRVCFKRIQRRKNPLTGREKLVHVRDYIGIREFFPKTFRTAVRQKSRWVLGITLQGWESLGWVGGFWMRYMLFRDRISLLTNQVNMLANVLVPVYLLIWGYVYLFPQAYRFPPIVQAKSPLYYLLLANLCMLLWQLSVRFCYVARIYGLKQAALSPPRLIWANIINFFATARAIKQYMAYRFYGKSIAWDKTEHVYPSEQELAHFRRRLGDLLLDRRFLTVEQLDWALERQQKTGQPLGTVLLDMGFVNDEQLLQVLGMQFSLQTTEIDPYNQDLSTISLIPREFMLRHQIYPVDITKTGELVVATDKVPSADELRQIENHTGRKVQLKLTSRGELSFALRRGLERLRSPKNQNRLGTELLAKGLISQGELDNALRHQRRSYRKLGDILVSRGDLTQQQIDDFITSGAREQTGRGFGEQLVNSGLITRIQLEQALEEQNACTRLLGEILVEQEVLRPEALNEVLKDIDKTEAAHAHQPLRYGS